MLLKKKFLLMCLIAIPITFTISCTNKQTQDINKTNTSTEASTELSTKTETSSEDNTKKEEQKPSGFGILSGMNDKVPEAEQEYIDKVLSKITKNSTKEEVLKLLGEPSRDLGWKLNWWVKIDNKDSRVGVFFTSKDGAIEKVVLDGGMGRFYYCKELK